MMMNTSIMPLNCTYHVFRSCTKLDLVSALWLVRLELGRCEPETKIRTRHPSIDADVTSGHASVPDRWNLVHMGLNNASLGIYGWPETSGGPSNHYYCMMRCARHHVEPSFQSWSFNQVCTSNISSQKKIRIETRPIQLSPMSATLPLNPGKQRALLADPQMICK